MQEETQEFAKEERKQASISVVGMIRSAVKKKAPRFQESPVSEGSGEERPKRYDSSV